MNETRQLGVNSKDIAEAVDVLIQGGVVGFPTDTVYGIGADMRQPQAVAALYHIKRRPRDRAIPLLLASADGLYDVAQEVPQAAHRLAARFWPGALTLVVRVRQGSDGLSIPSILTAGAPTVAVRVPDHAVVRALIEGLGAPLAATSANISDQPSPVTAQDVLDQLAGRIDLLLDGGPCPGGQASTVVDVTVSPPRILRSGPITVDQIRRTLAREATMG